MLDHGLIGKVAIVSGGSRGIGKAIVRAYAKAGANVIISSRKPENVLSAADEINDEFPGKVFGEAIHAGEPTGAQRLVELALSKFGRVDIVVNNASTNPHFGPILTAEESHWDKILQVNVKGYFWLCQAAAKQMQNQGEGGKIINIASVAGLEPGLMMGVYSVSKAAVIMMTKSLALELGADNIQVNAIAPGFIKSSFSRALWSNPTLSESIVNKTPAGRFGNPEEITGIALYLASVESDFTSGSVFKVDGGYTLT